MSVQSLDEGSPHITHVAPPGLVVHVVPMHVVHQPSEAPALLVTKLADAEPPVILRDFLLRKLAQLPCLGWLKASCSRSPSAPLFGWDVWVPA